VENPFRQKSEPNVNLKLTLKIGGQKNREPRRILENKYFKKAETEIKQEMGVGIVPGYSPVRVALTFWPECVAPKRSHTNSA
jgi:hypothetical protein